jgi:tetratricopeptide (TPR) repeat protein
LLLVLLVPAYCLLKRAAPPAPIEKPVENIPVATAPAADRKIVEVQMPGGTISGEAGAQRPALAPPPPAILPPETAAGEPEDKPTLAWRLYSDGKYGESARVYGELSATEPDALLGLGLSLYMLKDMPGAARALEGYLARAKGANPVAKKALAFVHFELDDLDKSLRYAESALADRDDGDLRVLLARVKNEVAVRGSAIKESTAHFTAIFDGYTQGGLSRQVLGLLEEAYSKIGSDMGHFPRDPVTVILYGERDFVEVLQKPEWAGAVYDGKIRLPVKGAGANPDALRHILFHEYTHALVHDIAPNCPVWINEGLAEYFSRPPTDTINQVIPLVQLEKPFSRIKAVPLDTAYLESYSAVRHLVERYGLYRVKGMLEYLGAGRPLNDAFVDAFGESYDRFVAEWGK